MADNIQDTAAQAEQGTPLAQEQESNTQDNLAQVNEGQDIESKATSETQNKEAEKSSSGENGDQLEQEAKPSRIERRIKDLSSKVREYGQSQAQRAPVKSGQNYFTPEELEEGAIDPNTFMQRVQSTVQSEVAKAIQMDRLQQQYQSSVREHQADLDSIKDIDPDFESEAVAEYERLNYQINPFTGEKEFVPAVKLSEIVSKMKATAEKLAEKIAREKVAANEQHLKEVSSFQAVPTSAEVSSAKTSKPDTTNFAEFEKAYS